MTKDTLSSTEASENAENETARRNTRAGVDATEARSERNGRAECPLTSQGRIHVKQEVVEANDREQEEEEERENDDEGPWPTCDFPSLAGRDSAPHTNTEAHATSKQALQATVQIKRENTSSQPTRRSEDVSLSPRPCLEQGPPEESLAHAQQHTADLEEQSHTTRRLRRRKSPREWACGACTLLNPVAIDYCSVCETSRNSSAPATSTSVEPTDSVQSTLPTFSNTPLPSCHAPVSPVPTLTPVVSSLPSFPPCSPDSAGVPSRTKRQRRRSSLPQATRRRLDKLRNAGSPCQLSYSSADEIDLTQAEEVAQKPKARIKSSPKKKRRRRKTSTPKPPKPRTRSKKKRSRAQASRASEEEGQEQDEIQNVWTQQPQPEQDHHWQMGAGGGAEHILRDAWGRTARDADGVHDSGGHAGITTHTQWDHDEPQPQPPFQHQQPQQIHHQPMHPSSQQAVSDKPAYKYRSLSELRASGELAFDTQKFFEEQATKAEARRLKQLGQGGGAPGNSVGGWQAPSNQRRNRTTHASRAKGLANVTGKWRTFKGRRTFVLSDGRKLTGSKAHEASSKVPLVDPAQRARKQAQKRGQRRA